MKIYSELTKQEYPTVEACQKAEMEYGKALVEAKEKQNKLSAEKKARADAIAAAYKKVIDAQKEYVTLKNAFINDYGQFHMTYRSEDNFPLLNVFEDWFKVF